MMKSTWNLVIVAPVLLLAVVPLLAHHSFMAEFDMKQPVTLQGLVTKVEWQNPHTYFYLDVKGDGSQSVNWALETGSPSALMARGWLKETVKPGDRVTVRGYRSRERPKVAAARSVQLPDGRTLFGGQTDDGGPAQ